MDMRKAWLFAAWAVVTAAIAGCGGSSEPAATAVSTAAFQGQFRGGSGMVFVFTEDGRFGVQGNPATGNFRLDGDVLTLTPPQGPTGQTVSGKRLGPDEIILAYPTGVTEHLFRVGSASAQSTAAQARHDPVSQQGPKFDRSVPLSRYTELSDSDRKIALEYLTAAYREPPYSDEQILARFSDAAAKEPDAFKRRDLAATEIPRINATLAPFKEQRYYSVKAYEPTALSTFPKGYVLAGSQRIGHYDFDKKGFPWVCLDRLAVQGGREGKTLIQFGTDETVPQQCVLSVPDENVAKAIEAAANSRGVAVVATFYFYVVRGQDYGVGAVATHGRVDFFPQNAADTEPAIANVDVAFPQPAYP